MVHSGCARDLAWGSRVLTWLTVEGYKPEAIKLDPVDPGASLPGGFPWESPHGYGVSRGGWVFGPSGRRLFMAAS